MLNPQTMYLVWTLLRRHPQCVWHIEYRNAWLGSLRLNFPTHSASIWQNIFCVTFAKQAWLCTNPQLEKVPHGQHFGRTSQSQSHKLKLTFWGWPPHYWKWQSYQRFFMFRSLSQLTVIWYPHEEPSSSAQKHPHVWSCNLCDTSLASRPLMTLMGHLWV